MSDSPPPRLLRFYKDQQFADAFVNDGSIRLSQLKAFVDSADIARADPSEGHGRLSVPNQTLTSVSSPSGKQSAVQGDLECGFVSGNPTFIFCTSLPEVDIETMKGKMGPHIVDIFNPQLFCQELKKGLRKKDQIGEHVFELMFGQVWYNKGEAVAKSLDWAKYEHLSYLQKTASYSHEREFRFIATFNYENFIDELMHIDVQLENPRGFAKAL